MNVRDPILRLPRFVAALAGFVACGLLATASAEERFRVCSITINSDDEIRTFRKHLPKERFEFVELTSRSSPDRPSGEAGWFTEACESGVRCDVLVVSGHFSDIYAGSYGTTFAGDTGYSLALTALESRRCDRSCPGILEAPLEVFLFGCRTLATGLPGRRLPATDRALLAEHGVSARSADEILKEIRFGGEETSNERRMRFAFAGVPHVYGFSWTAPAGAPIAPLLDRYLRGVGSYEKHLREITRRRAAGQPAQPNRRLGGVLRSGTFTESAGFGAKDPELRHDAKSCFLRSARSSTAERLDRIESLPGSREFLLQLPAIAAFLKSVDPEGLTARERETLERIRANDESRRVVLAFTEAVRNPLLRLEALRVARQIGWIVRDDALLVERAIVLRLLEPPVYGEGRDVLCGMEAGALQALEIRADELSHSLFGDEHGIEALGCLRPRDPAIHARLGAALSDPRDWISRAAAAALRPIRPAEVDVQLALARQLGREDASLRVPAAQALRAIRPSDPRVLAAIREAAPAFAIDWE